MAKKIKEEEKKIKAYVVMSQHFEYDDNYNNAQDGGTPVKVYLNKAKAEEECAKKNIVEICGCNLDNYSYNIREDKDALEALRNVIKTAKGKITHDGKKGEEYNIRIELPANVSTAQVNEILNILGVWFHQVEEVDVDIDI